MSQPNTAATDERMESKAGHRTAILSVLVSPTLSASQKKACVQNLTKSNVISKVCFQSDSCRNAVIHSVSYGIHMDSLLHRLHLNWIFNGISMTACTKTVSPL